MLTYVSRPSFQHLTRYNPITNHQSPITNHQSIFASRHQCQGKHDSFAFSSFELCKSGISTSGELAHLNQVWIANVEYNA